MVLPGLMWEALAQENGSLSSSAEGSSLPHARRLPTSPVYKASCEYFSRPLLAQQVLGSLRHHTPLHACCWGHVVNPSVPTQMQLTTSAVLCLLCVAHVCSCACLPEKSKSVQSRTPFRVRLPCLCILRAANHTQLPVRSTLLSEAACAHDVCACFGAPQAPGFQGELEFAVAPAAAEGGGFSAHDPARTAARLREREEKRAACMCAFPCFSGANSTRVYIVSSRSAVETTLGKRKLPGTSHDTEPAPHRLVSCQRALCPSSLPQPAPVSGRRP